MKKVLITCPIFQIAKDILADKFLVTMSNKIGGLSYNELLAEISNYDAILTMLSNKIDQKMLNKASKLQVISNYAIGLDNIDVEYARKKSISVYNLPDIVTNSTADFTFAIFLSLIRKIIPANKFVLDNKWNFYDPNLFLGEELNQKTFGIVGMGRCGIAVAKRAVGFGLNVIYYNRSVKKLSEEYTQVSFNELLERSDYISIHVPLNNETHHMFTEKQFQQMKKKPTIINMARGSIINTFDLIEALQNKQITACALDVTDPEPINKSHPLCNFDNCLILPHIGTATKECRHLMAKKAALNIVNHFNY
jgi:glyoxylate reductase